MADESELQLSGLPRAVRIAERLRGVVEFVGRWAAWLSLPVIIVTCIDVIGRKSRFVDSEGITHDVDIHAADGWDAVLANVRMYAPALARKLEVR